jgi:hypothetical protein
LGEALARGRRHGVNFLRAYRLPEYAGQVLDRFQTSIQVGTMAQRFDRINRDLDANKSGRTSQREQDGSEVGSLELGLTLIARRNSFIHPRRRRRALWCAHRSGMAAAHGLGDQPRHRRLDLRARVAGLVYAKGSTNSPRRSAGASKTGTLAHSAQPFSHSWKWSAIQRSRWQVTG